MVQASRCDELRARVPPPAAELAPCAAFALSRDMAISLDLGAFDRRLLGLLGLEGPQAAGRRRVGSMSGISVHREAALNVLESLHAHERARAMSRHRGCPCCTFCTAFARADLGRTF